MRKARFDLKRVICKNASCIGYSSNVARPGYWVSFTGASGEERIGRVMGRIAETDRDGKDCAGFLVVMALSMEATHAGVRWVDPADVRASYANPPATLLAWITGDEWVRNKADVARMVAMFEHGTCSDSYISNRDNPDQAYNARPEYVAQFVLKG